jgi:Dolichyl-phosphate-mannose-protein mannosyltransferase
MTFHQALEARTVAGSDDSTVGLARLGQLLSRTSVRLGLLLLACLVPRAVLACKLVAVSDDGFSYLHIADALERGRLAQALEYLNLNVYPLVLVGLHKLGLEWTIAGKLWGVLIATAIALPLYDWLRRMFDERVATAGVFLYAVHPKLIEYSVEPIREATFWFFFVLGIDFLWRCFEERRWWQFVAAGAALALALHTRIEGWFLLAPLAAWGAASWWRAPAARLRLTVGVLLCLAMTPLLLLVMNVTLLAHYPTWEFGRLSPFAVVAGWVRSTASHTAAQPTLTVNTTPAPAAVAAPAPAQPPGPTAQPAVATADSAKSDSLKTMDSRKDVTEAKVRTVPLGRRYLIEFVRTVGVPFFVLALIGLWTSLGSLRDPRRALLPVWSAATLVAIWVQLAHAGEMNGRYFLTLAFIDAGFAAAGCLTVMRWLQAAAWLPANWNNRLVAAALVPVCLLAAGWTQSFTSRHGSRRMEAKLGRWTKAHTGPIHRAVSDFQAVRPAYFAAGGMPEVVKYDEFFNSEFDHDPPDLLVIDPRTFSSRLLPLFLERATDLGLVPLDQQGFSSAPAKFLIYVRPSKAPAAPAGTVTPVAHVSNPLARN